MMDMLTQNDSLLFNKKYPPWGDASVSASQSEWRCFRGSGRGPGILHRLRHDLAPVYLPRRVRQKQRNRADAAIRVDDRLLARQHSILNDTTAPPPARTQRLVSSLQAVAQLLRAIFCWIMNGINKYKA